MKNETTRTGTTAYLTDRASAHLTTANEDHLAFGFRRFSAACSEKLNELKERVTANLAAEFAGALNSKTVRQVVSEADSLAAMTPFPALFLPALAEEKVRNALAWQARQQVIREQTLAFAA